MSELDETVASALAKRYQGQCRPSPRACRASYQRPVLAKAFSFWQQLRPPGSASDGQLELLHRCANREDRLRPRPPPRIQRSESSVERRGSQAIRRRRGYGSQNHPMHNRRKIGRQNIQGWAPNAKNRLEIVVICAAHIQHHIGQMIYLSYQLSRQNDGSAS